MTSAIQTQLDLKASIAYADSLVVGLLDDRGNYDASGNVFPSTGGSGTAGAVMKGDIWTISVAGTLGGTAVTAGDMIRALVDAPGQTASNWAVSETNIGYTALNAALNDGQIYIGNSSNVGTARTLSGDVTVSNTGVTAIGAGKVTNAMLAGSIDLTAKVTGVLPVANGGTGINSLGAGVATFLGTPSSANLAAAVTGETGTGALVFGTSPDFTTSATIGGVAIPTISSSNTFTNKTLTASSNVLGGVTMTLGSDADGDIYYRASNVLTRLPKGTALQVLRMNAGATAPEWAANAASMTVGSSTITSGAATRLLYETSGNVLGEVSGATSNGTNVTFGSGNLLATSPAFTTDVTVTRNSIGVTSADGLALLNTTAAAVGAQQYGPRIRFKASGWKTTATAGAQDLEMSLELQAVQGTNNPTPALVIARQMNGTGGFIPVVTFDSQNTTESIDGYGRMYLGRNANSGAYNGLVASSSGLDVVFNGTSVFGSAQNQRFDMHLKAYAKANLHVGPTSLAVGTSGTNVLVVGNGTAPTTSPADEFQIYSGDSAAGDANAFARNELGEINRLTGLACRVSTQFDKTSSTTLADITGLSRNVEASRSYSFTAILYTTSNSAGGVKVAIGGTATATSIIYEVEVKDGSTISTVGTARATALATTVGDVTAVTVARIIITGTIVVNAAGTLTVQFAQNVSNGTASSVLVNSVFFLRPIG